ncbi:MAG TPA: AI-2E family transporter [Terriglobales bacterium]|nr:AI-2E family transporter [Terriglobales bacterium]
MIRSSAPDNFNKRLLTGAGIIVLLVVCWFIRKSLLVIWVSIIFAIVFTPAVHWVQRRHIGKWSPGKGSSLFILLVVATLVLTIFFFFAIPPIVSDVRGLTYDFPRSLDQLSNQVRNLPFGAKLAEMINSQNFSRLAVSITGSATTALSKLTGMLSTLLILVLLTCYFILDGRRSFEWALGFIPEQNRGRTRHTLERASHTVQKWLLGQALLMLILGAASLLVYGILGVRYFYTLAAFTGLANFIPVIGPVISVLMSAAVAAIDSWLRALGVIAFYFAYQQLENGYLSPKIVGGAVGLPGVAIIASLVIGAELAGILGALVAVPSAALISEVLNEYVRTGTRDHEQSRKAA